MGMTNETPKDELDNILDIENSLPEPGEPSEAGDSPELSHEATPPLPSSTPVFKGSGMRWGLLGGLILVVAIVILAAQNTQSVEFSFLAWEVTAPLSALILGSAVLAVVLDELAGWVWGIRRRRQLRHKAELKQLKAETAPEKTKRFGRS
jgi:uncharacterized integral membrane protein